MKPKSTKSKPILTQKVLNARIRKAAPAMLGALDSIRYLSKDAVIGGSLEARMQEINHLAHRAIAEAQGSNP